ncbi:hypothetical protein NBRC10513_000331 [Rhodotorula toruloides]
MLRRAGGPASLSSLYRTPEHGRGRPTALLASKPAIRTPLLSPLSNISPPSRSISGRAALGRLPAFNWRTGPYAGQKCHEVQVVTKADDANLILESWTADRIAIDFEAGPIPNLNFARRPSLRKRDTTLSEGVLGLSDGYGVLLMQVPFLDRIPEKFREMMENPALQKVAIGAGWHVSEMLLDVDHFKTQPTNVLCLRRLACLACPTLDTRDLNNMVLDGWAQHMGKEVLGVRHSVYTQDFGYRMDLKAEKRDLLVNRTWFVHCADVAIRQRLRNRIANKAGGLKEVGKWMEADWTEEEAFKYAQQFCSYRNVGDMPHRAQ